MRCPAQSVRGVCIGAPDQVARGPTTVTAMTFCPDCGVYWAPSAASDACWVCGRPGEPHRSPAITCQIAPGDPVPTE